MLPAQTGYVTEEEVERIARAFHARYEWWAARLGWNSQVGSTLWEDVPEANKATMLATVRSLLEVDVIRSGAYVDAA